MPQIRSPGLPNAPAARAGGQAGARLHLNPAANRARVLSERRGRRAELLAAASLVCRGYRILGWRHRNPQGEIDLIAVRGRRLAFVEVKQRATVEAAGSSISPSQTRRMQRAAEHWLGKRPYYSSYTLGFDAVFVVPGRWPSYRPDQLQAKAMALRA
jgi:putative endonuclease